MKFKLSQDHLFSEDDVQLLQQDLDKEYDVITAKNILDLRVFVIVIKVDDESVYIDHPYSA